MIQNTDTKLELVPTHPRLTRRGSQYYFRVVVPEELRSILGRREIKHSLRTSDYTTARRMINLESERADRQLDQARAKLVQSRNASVAKQASPRPSSNDEDTLVVTSENDALAIAQEWLIKLERDGERWWNETGIDLDSSDKNEVLSDLWFHKAAYTREAPDVVHPTNEMDGSEALTMYLGEHKERLSRSSEAFELLRRYFRLAEIEHYCRQMDRVESKPVVAYDDRFRDVFAHSLKSERRDAGITLKQLCEKLIASYKKAGKAHKTILQYRITATLLQDIFGSSKPANSIGHAEVERYCEVIETFPVNAKKKYPGLGVSEIIKAAKHKGDTSRLAGTSRRNRFFSAFTIFKFGVEINELPSNPFDNRLLKERFQTKQKHGKEKKAPFTVDQLNKIFSAPLYTGSVDDERGYATKGTNVVKRARYWVPLIGLFQGMRLNEICQLYTEDVKDWENGLYFDIRPDLEGGSNADDKGVKNNPSRRCVPVHPELLRMGFADFVKARRADGSSPRLFCELTKSEDGSYSDRFSKWFGNFLTHVFGDKSRESFHSFRHTFTDAIRKTDATDRQIDRLCGWAGSASRMSGHYGENRDLNGLFTALSTVNYPNVKLLHLEA